MIENLEELKRKYEELGNEIKKFEKKNRWRAKENEVYYFVNSLGDIISDCESYCRLDDFRYKTRNYFRTSKEAEDYLEKINIYCDLKNLAEELNDEEIDFDNPNQTKFYFEYNSHTKEFLEYGTVSVKEINQIYCLDKKFLEIAKERIGEDQLIKLFK